MAPGSADDPGELPVELLRYVDRIDRGEFWLAHEDLEELWQRERRDSYKGLIHLAAALLHGERGYRRGARAKIESSIIYLQADPACPGFDSKSLRELLVGLRDGLDLAEQSADDLARWSRDRPPLRPIFRAEVPEGFAPAEDLPQRVRRHDEGYRTRRDPRRRD